ncbi:Ribose-5-phosphate isomerase OS=Ustilago maydis (strain 521 / FGSC 9021) GN=RKI1 PE=3 SV=1 [Rhizoctonia solani AG-1 IB]|uniref:Ribose-5-phosphate isomerase n=1 Tax=Thanatephorus cucumeris (strain AG1-IB / isolate 7/3/14) TaxID=1108050 RepID=A0A0B7FUN6_THACB|nr:Ribose-5-phosphate isomerase OS=Ustilago maydis (strain 521 / FGSC 9021) GN=RKI1 PE=3 SV=1 [Rhizoctonia solani AG-1 IB]
MIGGQSKELIVGNGLKLGDVDQYPIIDVTIDGADEVDEELNCIKGGGACHLREKALAEAAETRVPILLCIRRCYQYFTQVHSRHRLSKKKQACWVKAGNKACQSRSPHSHMPSYYRIYTASGRRKLRCEWPK